MEEFNVDVTEIVEVVNIDVTEGLKGKDAINGVIENKNLESPYPLMTFWSGTQTQYDSITEKENDRLYFIE